MKESQQNRRERSKRLEYLLNNHTLDWITLFQMHKLYTKEDRGIKLQDLMSTLESLFDFNYESFSENNEMSIESKCRCIKIYVNQQRSMIQFRGLFFLTHQDQSLTIIEKSFESLYRKVFPSINETMKHKLSKKKHTSKNSWRVTRIDIMRNLLNTSIKDAFPIMQDEDKILNGDEGLYWSTKCSPQPFFKDNKLTGIILKMRDASITTYNKTLESKNEKNRRKRALFNEYYSVGAGDTITRIELKLTKKVKCSDFTQYLIGRVDNKTPKKEERLIIELALSRFAQRNRVYIINKKEKNKRRWKLDPRFEKFITTSNSYKKVKAPNFSEENKMTNSQTLDRAITTIANQILEPKSLSKILSKKNTHEENAKLITRRILNSVEGKIELIKEEHESSKKARSKPKASS